MPYMDLFHVTPEENLYSIGRYGIDPSFAIGKLKSVWMCAEPSIAWAMAHVSFRKKISVDKLAVLRVSVEFTSLKRTAWRNVYRINENVTPYGMLTEKEIEFVLQGVLLKGRK